MNATEIDKLINEISKLPGLGRKSAQRIALHLLKNKKNNLLPLAQIMKEANDKIANCEICGNIDMISPCSICQNLKRDHQTICIIEDISDLWTLERIGFYRGAYHVLGGTLSAINGIGIDELSIKSQQEYDPELNTVTDTSSLVIGKSITSKLYFNYSIGLIDKDLRWNFFLHYK